MLRPASFLFAIAVLAACSPSAPRLNVHDGWARETGRSDMASAYLTIDNQGGADKLTAVRSTTGQATLHESTMDGGVMRMRPIDPRDGLVVPSNGTLRLAPGGAHVMIMGLKQPLKAGDRFDLTLKFDKAGSRKVAIAVKAATE